MSRQRRNTRPLDDIPSLFDDLSIDMTLGHYRGDASTRHQAEAELLASERAKAAAAGASDDLTLKLKEVSATDRLMFVSFGSGSSGNCAYIGTRSQGLLIDAGVAPETVKKLMADNGLDYNSIRGILLTHDHGDHMSYAYKLLRKQTHMMLYTTPKALNGLLRRHSISSRIKDYHHPIYKEHLYRIGDFEVTAFETSHDGTDNMGFFIQFGPHHKFAVVTDTGFVTERADHYMRQARYIMLESNYDAGMLKHGPYTEILKSRISSASGHLDNADAAGYLARIYTPQLTHVFLCHLSNDNNTPELALEASRRALADTGIAVGDGSGSPESQRAQIQLTALPRYDASPLYVFREP